MKNRKRKKTPFVNINIEESDKSDAPKPTFLQPRPAERVCVRACLARPAVSQAQPPFGMSLLPRCPTFFFLLPTQAAENRRPLCECAKAEETVARNQPKQTVSTEWNAKKKVKGSSKRPETVKTSKKEKKGRIWRRQRGIQTSRRT